MKKIAILLDSYDYDKDEKVINSITEWTEVSDEEYALLKRFGYLGNYSVIEQPIDPPKWILNTVAKYVELAKKEDEKAEKAKLAREKKKKELEKKKKELEAQKEKELFEQLKAKFGDK